MNVRAPKTAWEIKVSLPRIFSISFEGIARAETMDRRVESVASTRSLEAETVIAVESRMSLRNSILCVGNTSFDSLTGMLRVFNTQSRKFKSLVQAFFDLAIMRKLSQYTTRLRPHNAQYL
jgi:hypothetical protein